MVLEWLRLSGDLKTGQREWPGQLCFYVAVREQVQSLPVRDVLVRFCNGESVCHDP